MAACDAMSIVAAAIRAACDARPPRKTVAAVAAAVSAVFRPASTAVANLRRQSQVPKHAPLASPSMVMRKEHGARPFGPSVVASANKKSSQGSGCI